MKITDISESEVHLIHANEAGYESGKQYGIRYKVFAGREGRLTTKEKWFKTAAQLEAFAEKVSESGNFYEIDGYSYPHESTVTEDESEGDAPAGEERQWGTDTIALTVPAFIRCLEWAREDAPDDTTLHQFTEKAVNMEGAIESDELESMFSQKMDEISDAAAQRLMMKRMQNNWAGKPGAEEKNTKAKVAVANRAARKSGQRGVDMSRQIHIGEATDPKDIAARPTWQIEADIQYLKPMKWQPSAAEEIQALEAELARRKQIGEDASAGATCSASMATGTVGAIPGKKKKVKEAPVVRRGGISEGCIQSIINELDNGPKGRVKTDNISYDARRSSNTGLSHAAKDDMAFQRDYNARMDKEEKEQARRQAAQRRAAKTAKPSVDLDEVWRKVEQVVGAVFPDGDPIDWLGPWCEKRGIPYEMVDKAARKNGYKDVYAYYNSMRDLMDGDM